METLNLEWLTNRGACQPAYDAWRERWGDADVPLADVLLALADHPDGVAWWGWLHWRHETVYDLHCRDYGPAVREAENAYFDALCNTYAQRLTGLRYWQAITPVRERREAAHCAELRRLAAMLAETSAEAQ